MSFFSTMAQGLGAGQAARMDAVARLDGAMETVLPVVTVDKGTVQVWRLNVERWAGCAMMERAYEVLTAAERERAARFRRPVARAEFIAGRGWLRLLLAAVLKQGGLAVHPRDLPLETGEYGKPRLAASFADGLKLPEFNVAHARGTVLIAFSQAGPVGIDIEYMDESVEALEIARASFAEAEVAAMERAGTERERLALFYRLWTRKEATAKADGRGLQLALDSFTVAVPGSIENGSIANGSIANGAIANGGEYAIVVRSQAEAATYFLRELPAGTGLVAAIALTKPGVAVYLDELTSAQRAGQPRIGSAGHAATTKLPWLGNPASITDWEVTSGQRGMVTPSVSA